MRTNPTPKAEVERAMAGGRKLKVFLRGLAVVAVTLLAGLVFTRYEAGIPLENTPIEYMHVTVSAHDMANPMEPTPVRQVTPG
jgi:hypothetical protein